MNGPVARFGAFDGHAVYVFPQERGHFSAVIVRPSQAATTTPTTRPLLSTRHGRFLSVGGSVRNDGMTHA